MPTTFIVTASTSTATLDSARQGKASFTVANTGAQGVRTRSYASVEGAGSADWLAIEGLPVRDLAPGATETYVVAINVPADAPPGNYSFKLNVVGVDNPDEEFASSQPVSFAVSGAAVRPPVKKGYMEALAGALVGAFAGGAVGAIPALLFILTTGQAADFSEAIGFIICFVALAVIGAPLGLWIGAAIGTWAGLKWRGCEYPRRTALIVAIALPVLLFLAALLLGIFDIENSAISNILTVLIAGIVVAGSALGARALVLLLTTKQL